MSQIQPEDIDLPYHVLLARSMEELRMRTGSHDRLFQIGRADWALNQDDGVIVFTSPNGFIASAPAQIVGTYDTVDGTWVWSWDNPSILPDLCKHALLARQYGQKNGLPEYTTRQFKTDENRCWELTACTCKLGCFQGAYRGPAGDTMVFITFGDVKLQKG